MPVNWLDPETFLFLSILFCAFYYVIRRVHGFLKLSFMRSGSFEVIVQTDSSSVVPPRSVSPEGNFQETE
jgi:hypothetical protein